MSQATGLTKQGTGADSQVRAGHAKRRSGAAPAHAPRAPPGKLTLMMWPLRAEKRRPLPRPWLRLVPAVPAPHASGPMGDRAVRQAASIASSIGACAGAAPTWPVPGEVATGSGAGGGAMASAAGWLTSNWMPRTHRPCWPLAVKQQHSITIPLRMRYYDGVHFLCASEGGRRRLGEKSPCSTTPLAGEPLLSQVHLQRGV